MLEVSLQIIRGRIISRNSSVCFKKPGSLAAEFLSSFVADADTALFDG